MKKLIIFVTFVLLMVFSAMAVAQGMGPGRGMGRNMPTFAEFDLDKSGALDKDEFIEARGMRVSERARQGRMMRGLSSMMQFADMDLDTDGRITPEEFAQGVAIHRQKKMQQ